MHWGDSSSQAIFFDEYGYFFKAWLKFAADTLNISKSSIRKNKCI